MIFFKRNIYKRILSIFLVIAIALPLLGVKSISTTNKEMKAVWVSSVYNLDFPIKPTTSASTLRKEADDIIAKSKKLGLNAIILQVRPSADSLYKSDFFPWSTYLTGTQGKAPDNGFDPLKYWIEQSHKNDIELHAWINPFRITKKEKAEFDKIVSTHPAKKNPSYVIRHTDKNYYFNPGLPEVRKLIIDSTVEIVKNYDIDGIHLDDYFYPGKDFPDEDAYKKYGSKFKNIGDWRRDNVTTLIKELGNAVHQEDKNIQFGVSPAGIWANKKNSNLGSDTNGNESYYSHYADTRKWVKDEIIDYITPQIYWEIGHAKADYKTLTNWWADVVRGTDVKLYIGMAVYRAGDKNTQSPWFGTTSIKNQFAHNKTVSEIQGTMLFRYGSIAPIAGMEELLAQEYKEITNLVPSPNPTPTDSPHYFDAPVPDTSITKKAPKTLNIGRPEINMETKLSKYYITGSSDASKPLFLNGVEIKNRSSNGYWGHFATLKNGKNTFKVTQGNASDTIIITKGNKNTSSSKSISESSGSSSNIQKTPALANAYPTSDLMQKTSNTINLSVVAPISAKVKAKINGTSVDLKPKTTKKPAGGKIHTTTYTYNYKIPNFTGAARTVHLGNILYTMTYNGKTTSATSSGKVSAFMPSALVIAEVKTDFADIYFTENSSDGSSGELSLGMRDMATDFSGNYIKLSSGNWIHNSKVKLMPQASKYSPKILSTKHDIQDKYEKITFEMSAPIAGYLDIKDNKLMLEIPTITNASNIKLLENSMFASSAANISNNIATYTLTIKDRKNLNGYYFNLDGKNLEFYAIKRPKISDNLETPLSGIRILVDPGHGGANVGATGSGGSQYAEKDINWAVSIKLFNELKRLGANVYLTRGQNEDPSLASRIDLSRKIKPDMLISVHTNSLSDGIDMENVQGLAVFYYNDLSKNAAKGVFDRTKKDLSRLDKGFVQKKFFVTKSTLFPSYLYETGFIPNPKEYDFLTNDAQQTKLANSIAMATVEYFK